jgi:hypothetical protein
MICDSAFTYLSPCADAAPDVAEEPVVRPGEDGPRLGWTVPSWPETDWDTAHDAYR